MILASKALKSNEFRINKVCSLNEHLTNDNIKIQNLLVVQEPLNCETQSNTWIDDRCITEG